ncbi:uncharacterized protein [Amphiura filiformis]|uniref:uncharacterized protein n=1 Tax=Amphiura filiformis TaxID=82378 RepID=UPI003B218A5A
MMALFKSYQYLLLATLLVIYIELAASEVNETMDPFHSRIYAETNDTVQCHQHFILQENNSMTIQTYGNETCDFRVSSSNDQGITLNVLHLSLWSIYDYFTLQESGEECINRSYGWIGSLVGESCALVLNCSAIHVNMRASSILEIQQSSKISSTEDIKWLDSDHLHTKENIQFRPNPCENVHIFDEIDHISYDEIPYARLQEFNPSLQITLVGDPDFKSEELAGFVLGLPDNVSVAAFPQCPVDCFCYVSFQVFHMDCPGAPAVKKTLLVYEPPGLVPEQSTVIDLSNRHLTRMESNSFFNLTDTIIVLLSQNHISSIGRNDFAGLENIHTLDLSINHISSIEAGSFSYLYTLKRLLLNVNKLTYISHSWLDGLVNVQVLYVGGNNITDIESDLFHEMESLKVLTLPNCSLSQVTLTNKLLLLDLSSNTLQRFPDDLSTNMTHLSLNNNRLSFLNQTVFDDRSSLISLVLSQNNISFIPNDTFIHLHDLKRLNLYSNRLIEIENGFLNGLSDLVSLDLQANSLESLPSGVFKELRQLKELYLYGNKLNMIDPDVFNGLTSLEVLNLGYNSIESLPSGTFRDLRQLKELYLYANKLNVIQSDFFNSLAKLEILGLHENGIESLPSGVFRDLNQLQELYLYANELGVIQSDLFDSLTKLQKLDLANNTIESLPSGVFKLSSLSYLSLDNNMLKTLPAALFKTLISLAELRLDGNRLSEMPKDIFHQFTGMPLQLLTIRSNKIAKLYPYQFSNLTYLTVLDLTDNHLKQIHSKSLYGLTKLKYLNLKKNSLTKITKTSFTGLALQNDSYIAVDDPATCCFAEPLYWSQCIPQNKPSPYLTCKQLLPTTVVKCVAWIFGFCALFANIVVFIWGCQKMKPKSADEKQVNQLIFITNLALADLLMGVYLLVVASADQYYNEYFPSYAKHWRTHVLCKLAGFLSVLSSEASFFSNPHSCRKTLGISKNLCNT